MIPHTARAAWNLGRYRFGTNLAGLRGDPAARLLRVRQPVDPFAEYERIRRHAGELYPSRLGVFCTVSQPFLREVTVDRRFIALKPAPGRPDWTVEPDDAARLVHPIERSLLSLDPPMHTDLRKLVSKWFTPTALAARVPQIRAIVHRALDDVAGQGEVDLVSQVSKYVPFEILRAIIGLPEPADRDRMIWWANTVVNAVDGPRTLTERRAVRTAVAEMTAYFTGLVERKRAHPDDDLASAVVTEGAAHDSEDLVALLALVYIAGQPTAACLLNNVVRLLCLHPEQKRLVLDDPSLGDDAVEESLRFDPSGRLIVRLASETVTVRGVEVPKGSVLVNFIAGANRDPGVFTDPHVFDLSRGNSREHVTFSGGVHHCLGAGVARLQAGVFVREVFERFPRLDLAGTARMSATRGHRSPASLPVRLERTRAVLAS